MEFVIGDQIAKATAAEERRKSKSNLVNSPMPRQKYEPQDDEIGLLRPRQVPLDDALAELSRGFAKADGPTRAAIRESISMQELYTLLAFCRRTAVFALRDRSTAWVIDGLNALAVIEKERVDWRDLLMALSLLNHAATQIGSDADQLLGEAERLSEPETARLIESFRKRPPSEKNLRTSWGHEEIEIDGQKGLIGCGIEPYQPTLDLAKVAIEIADLVAMDRYSPNSVEIATDLPTIWLETKDKVRLQSAMKAICAGVTIHASLRPSESADYASQMFVVFLVETQDELSAETLLELARAQKPENGDMLGVAETKLFCLVVAKSFVVGVKSVEAAGTLNRLSDGLIDILRRHHQ